MTGRRRPAVGETPEPAGPAGPAGSGPSVVTPDWLAAHLSDPDVVLLEVDADAASHHLAHVPTEAAARPAR